MTKDQKISENFYVRGDGTRAYYFSEDGLKKLFGDEGFVSKEMVMHIRQLENRARKIKMDSMFSISQFSSIEQQVAGVKVVEDIHEILKPCHLTPSKDNASAYRSRDGATRKSTGDYRQTLIETAISKESEEEIIIDLFEGFGADLFGGVPSPEPLEVVVGKYKVHALCSRNENQHTFAATGFMLWDSALALASLLAIAVELGCGSVGLCSLIASLAAEKVIATDGDSGEL